MYILLASATPFEIAPFTGLLANNGYGVSDHKIDVVITGIGSMISSFSLCRALAHRRPDFMIQAGIAGSFVPNFSPPQVVIVKSETMGDLGAAENRGFSDIFDLGLADSSGFPFENKKLVNPIFHDRDSYFGLSGATGITVNEISTGKDRVELLKNNYGAETESMEGAPFHYAALTNKIPFLQLRAISNIVGERNKQHWRMKDAIIALNETLKTILPQIN